MPTDQILTIRQTIATIGINAAERQLTLIGSNAGDEQLAQVVNELSAEEVAALIGEGDYTKPSLAVHFITPRQFIDALERFGARWGSIGKGVKMPALLELKTELAEFICSIVLNAQDGRRRDLIKALMSKPIGKDIINVLPIGEPEFDPHQTFDPRTHNKGTWEEIYALIWEVDLDAFNEHIRIQQTFFDDHGVNETSTEGFLKGTLKELVQMARTHSSKNRPKATAVTSEVFDI